jgi:hypothetical protein
MNKSDDSIGLTIFKNIIHLPIVWFILGVIGFLGNTLIYLQYKFDCQNSPQLNQGSRNYFLYVFCSSVVDIITLSMNLFMVYLPFMFDDKVEEILLCIVFIIIIFVYVILPHVSTNFLLMGYIDRFILTSGPKSSLRRINKLETAPWMISIILVCGCIASSGYLFIIFSPTSQDEKNIEKLACIIAIIYILTNGFIPIVLILIFVLLTYRNILNSRQRVVSVLFISGIR